MFTPESYSLAVWLCFITMICWGSWANTQKLSGANWRFELFYWDYVLGILLLTLVFAFTLGSYGSSGRSFMDDLRQADVHAVFSAALGGVVFNLANLLLVAAISIAGLSVAFPVGIGIALVLGVLVNYIGAPKGNFLMLIGGVILISIAIVLNARAYSKMQTQRERNSSRGLWLAVAAGLLMGFFYRFVARSMFGDFQVPEPGKMSPYSAMVCFALGVLASNFIFNVYLMRRPVSGDPVKMNSYFRGSIRNHLTGILGGVIWGVGMSFSILASGKAGAAISYGLGQGATVIAAIWGIFVWKEFRNASKEVSYMLNLMLLLYVAGIVMIIAAR